jgi:hypothetical protein
MNRQERDVGGVLVGVGHQGGARYGSAQRDGRTELVKAQAEEGQTVNFCPFGCYDDELDEQGYCYHLIGFSPNGKALERNQVGPDGRVRTIAPVRKVNGRFQIVHDERVDRRRHKLIPIVHGGSFRVYEDVQRPADYPEHISDELSDEELERIDAEEQEEPELTEAEVAALEQGEPGEDFTQPVSNRPARASRKRNK